MTEPIGTQLVAIGKAVAGAGLVVAAGGNLAARSGADRIVTTPTGWNLADLGPDDLVEVSLDGDHIRGAYRATSELPLHLAALRARPDAVWSLHAHPPMATLLDALGVAIRTLTTDHAFYLRTIGSVPYLHPGSTEVAEAAARAARTSDVVLLRHHGCLVLADTPELLLSRALNLEAAAIATYRAHLLGDRGTACPPEFLEHVLAKEAAGRRYGISTLSR